MKKMRKLFMILFILELNLVFWSSAFAQSLNDDAPSAVRLPSESYEELSERYRASLPPTFHSSRSASAEGAAVAYSALDLNSLPVWSRPETVEIAFNFMRDHRFIDWTIESIPFPRRLTWLYPDDGCFARAEVAAALLEEWGFQEGLAKVFVFGDLSVKTANHPNGRVTWWYHVVPGFMVNGVAMVFDPAIEAEKPLTLEKWLSLMAPKGDPNEVKVSICGRGAFGPSNDCSASIAKTKSSAIASQKNYLNAEWQRINNLGRDAVLELSYFPPWVQ